MKDITVGTLKADQGQPKTGRKRFRGRNEVSDLQGARGLAVGIAKLWQLGLRSDL